MHLSDRAVVLVNACFAACSTHSASRATIRASKKNRLRRLLATTLACYFAGCGVSAQTTGGQLNQIKPGMTREQVVGSLGEPAQTNLVNGAPSEDLYGCDEQGRIMVVRNAQSPPYSIFAAPLIFVPFAALAFIPVTVVNGIVTEAQLDNLSKRARKCAVNYDQGLVLSTSQTNGIVFTK